MGFNSGFKGLRGFEKRVLGKIFGSTRDEGTGELGEFESCKSLWSVLITAKKRVMSESRGTYGGEEKCTQGFDGETWTKWATLEDYYRMDLREIRWKRWYCIDLVQDREKWRAVVNAVVNLRAPKNMEKFWTSNRKISFSIRTLLHRVI